MSNDDWLNQVLATSHDCTVIAGIDFGWARYEDTDFDSEYRLAMKASSKTKRKKGRSTHALPYARIT